MTLHRRLTCLARTCAASVALCLAGNASADDLLLRARAEYEAGDFAACHKTYAEATASKRVFARLDKRSMAACHCAADDAPTIARGLTELETWASKEEATPEERQITYALINLCQTLLARQPAGAAAH